MTESEIITLNFTIGGFGRGYERIIWQDNKLHHKLFNLAHPEDETEVPDEILKERFGEEVIIKKFEKPKSWLSKKMSGIQENQIENFINILEEKSIWQRYGF